MVRSRHQPSTTSNDNGSMAATAASASLASIDRHRLDMLNKRISGGEGGITESSFTPPRSNGSFMSPASNNNMEPAAPFSGQFGSDDAAVSNLTDAGNNNSSSALAGGAAAGQEAAMSITSDDKSNASCQTVHHANMNLMKQQQLQQAKEPEGITGMLYNRGGDPDGKLSPYASNTTSRIMAGSNTNNNIFSSNNANGNGNGNGIGSNNVGSSKKKSTPSKRPASAIGDRRSVSPMGRSGRNKPSGGGELNGSTGSHHKKARSRTPTRTGGDANAAAAKAFNAGGEYTTSPKKQSSASSASVETTADADPQNSRSESRDTLHSYFGSSSSNLNNAANAPGNNNNGGNNQNSNPPIIANSASPVPNSSRSQLSSPPALQSKSFASSNREKQIGSQRTLHSFLGISDRKQEKEDDASGNGNGSRKQGDKAGANGKAVKDGATNGDAAATLAAASKPAASKHPAASENARPKKKRAQIKPPHPNSGPSDVTNAHTEEALTHEIKRLHTQLISLQKQLEDANARNNSIRNNQTLISAKLQLQLKHQKAELEEVKRKHGTKITKAMEVMERLVGEESVREAKELRQQLASDGARLGRLVSSRVGNGMRSQVIESWEDGHAPRQLKFKKGELKKRREGLERQKEELTRVAATSIAASNGEAAHTGDADASQISNPCNDNTIAGYATMNDLDRMEANETVRMHLEEVKRLEAELDGEERALNIEKRAHVRALKLVGNEDSSKFRSKRKLHDRYLLLNLLGKGGFSEVWRAFDLQTLRHVAVKIHQLEPSWSDAKKENYTKHVSREYEIQKEVRHPRIVSLYDVFEIDTDSFATVLECCKGSDLDTLLKDKGRLVERDARAILLQILSGMRYLSVPSADGRRQGIIHYDLKPGNILFDEAGNAKITDFGLSKIVDAAEEGDSMELTSQGAGTYWYLPPECFLMDQDVRISNKVDVWSIGVIYYQMLYGRRPFGDGQSQDHILRNQIMLNATEVHFPNKPGITEEGKAFIRDCLSYDQMSRPNMGLLCEHYYLRLTTTM